MDNAARVYTEDYVVGSEDKYYTVAGYKFEKGKKYTHEDYMKLPEDVRVELIDGVFYEKYPADPITGMAAPNRKHQKIVSELVRVIGNHINGKDGDCEVYPAPFDVQLKKDEDTVVQPDISVICDPKKLSDRGCEGAPDLVIEIPELFVLGPDELFANGTAALIKRLGTVSCVCYGNSQSAEMLKQAADRLDFHPQFTEVPRGKLWTVKKDPELGKPVQTDEVHELVTSETVRSEIIRSQQKQDKDIFRLRYYGPESEEMLFKMLVYKFTKGEPEYHEKVANSGDGLGSSVLLNAEKAGSLPELMELVIPEVKEFLEAL